MNEPHKPAAWQLGTSTDVGMRSAVTFRQHGRDVNGEVIGVRQTGRHRGKWEVRSLETGRIVVRTKRQLKLRRTD